MFLKVACEKFTSFTLNSFAFKNSGINIAELASADSFITLDKFTHDSRDDVYSLRGFINYIFKSTIAREATNDEFNLFKSRMIEQKDGKELFKSEFNIFITRDDPTDQEKRQRDARGRIAYAVLDYISRLEETYSQGEIK